MSIEYPPKDPNRHFFLDGFKAALFIAVGRDDMARLYIDELAMRLGTWRLHGEMS